MKKIFFLALALGCLLALAGCCEHEWTQADCLSPKTCGLCRKAEGEALGHSWQEADCLNAKTCVRCGETEGQPLGHSWAGADCLDPDICARCSEIQGQPLGHDWQDATTEAPETCARCALTRGEPIKTDPRFTTAACRELFGKWQSKMTLPTQELDPALAPYLEELPVRYNMEFRSDGTAFMFISVISGDALYDRFAAQGMTREEADSLLQQLHGVTGEDYTITPRRIDYVYYMAQNLLHLGFTWNTEMSPTPCTLENNTLTLNLNGQTITFNRVEE